MFEKIFKKQEKVQKEVQKQQELNDKDCRELTDEELEQMTGGGWQVVTGPVVTTQVVQGVQGAAVTLLDAQAKMAD